jgi:hypothetical protein
MACPPTLSRALAPNPACNPSAALSVIIIRRIEKTAIPLNTEAASVKIRSAKTARFYRANCTFPSQLLAGIRGFVFLVSAINRRMDFGRFPEIQSSRSA